MPRPLRLLDPSLPQHVTNRGVDRVAVVRDVLDRSHFVGVLRTTAVRYEWRCLAYCLMTNHYHLIIEAPQANASAGMQYLNSRYAEIFNRRHGRIGHLFQGRFASRPIATDAHLLASVAYVALNPVRAGIASDPALWPWSSFRATVGLDPPDFVAVDTLATRLVDARSLAETMWALVASAGADC